MATDPYIASSCRVGYEHAEVHHRLSAGDCRCSCHDISRLCLYPAFSASRPGALCVRRKGHVGVGLYCTADPQRADVLDQSDDEGNC